MCQVIIETFSPYGLYKIWTVTSRYRMVVVMNYVSNGVSNNELNK